MTVSAFLFLMLLSAVLVAGSVDFEHRGRRWPVLTLAFCAVVAMCLAAQIAFPFLLRTFERNTLQILDGRWWRLFSALFFQDGWLAGGLTNIAALLLVGTLAEQVLGRAVWVAVYFAGGVAAECVALRRQPVGAGNSIAVCALAGAMIVRPPLAGTTRLSGALRIVATSVAALLPAWRDIHGAGFFAGVLVHTGLAGWRRARFGIPL